jgi:hypothetical protein
MRLVCVVDDEPRDAADTDNDHPDRRLAQPPRTAGTHAGRPL